MAGTGLGKFVAGALLLLAPALLLAATVDPGAPGADRRQAARAGPFHLKRQLRLIPAFAAAMSAGQVRALARAPGATIYAAKVLDALGQGTESDVIAGIE